MTIRMILEFLNFLSTHFDSLDGSHKADKPSCTSVQIRYEYIEPNLSFLFKSPCVDEKIC
jgi:hypothetical protein